MQVQKADVEFGGLVNDWLKRHEDLTWLEAIGILLMKALEFKKYALRDERHPDNPEKKGDEA